MSSGVVMRRGVFSGVRGAVLASVAALSLAGCGQGVPPHLKPISKDAMHLLGKKGMQQSDPIFIRVFKEESELEVWKQRNDGRFHLFKTYPICNWSGALGPKLKQGDKQSPEGFYTVTRGQLNPRSKFHLAFNLGFPNSYDRAHGRTGSALMIHGDCRSAGCYAMTDALIEELYALVRESLNSGQERFHVHAFPFRMTNENFRRHRRNKWAPFWAQLKEGYDHFEQTRQIPKVDVCSRRYLVNAKFKRGITKVRADGICPPYTKIRTQLWAASDTPEQSRISGIAAQSLKVRALTEGARQPTSLNSIATATDGSDYTRRGFGLTGE